MKRHSMSHARSAALGLALLAGAAGSGCRDLGFPSAGEGDGGNSGPTLTFLSPGAQQLVPVVTSIRLGVEDANGVATVTLACGPATGGASTPLFSWTAGPYEGVADLTSCLPVQDGGPGARPTVLLTATAVDSLGNGSAQTLSVQLDAALPALTVRAPERARPTTEVELRIESDQDLASPPTLRIDGTAVAVQKSDGGARGFVARYTTGKLGIDRYTGPSDGGVPIEVLQEVERPLAVVVEGRSTSGNVAHVETEMRISRVVWDRPVPGIIRVVSDGRDTSLRATPSAGGVTLPLIAFTGGWVPGFFAAADGTYRPFDADLFSEGDYSPRAIDSEGRVWATRQPGGFGTPVETLLLAAETFQPIPSRTGSSSLETNSDRLIRVRDRLCEEHYSNTATACPVPTRSYLTCVGLTFDGRTPLGGNYDGGLTGTSVEAITSGDAYLGLTAPAHTPTCLTTSVNLIGTTTSGLSPVLLPSTTRVVPAGDGHFALAGSTTARLVDARGVIEGTYVAGGGCDPQICGGRGSPFSTLTAGADQVLYTLLPDSPDSRFQALPPDGGVPVLQSKVPGFYLAVQELNTTDGTLLHGPANAALGPNGELTALLRTGYQSVGVVAFDAQLRPLWLYRYPAVITFADAPPYLPLPQLVASPDYRVIYLVDPLNGRVVALAR